MDSIVIKHNKCGINMSLSRQTMLGMSVFLGGSVLLFASLYQVVSGGSKDTTKESTKIEQQSNHSTSQANNSTPLTIDIATEQRLLEEKRLEREKRVTQQELDAQQYMAEQQMMESEALARSRAENQLYTGEGLPANLQTIDGYNTNDFYPMTNNQTNNQSTQGQVYHSTNQGKHSVTSSNTTINQSQTTIKTAHSNPTTNHVGAGQMVHQKPTSVSQQPTQNNQIVQNAQMIPPASPITYRVKAGDGLISLARIYHVPVTALAQANNLKPNAQLNLGQKLIIPSGKQIEKLEREAKEAEIRAKQQELEKERFKIAQQKLKEARQMVKETNAQGVFGVQVALAIDEPTAQMMVKKLKSAGYPVKTSETTRGIRVVVGPEKGKIAALALKDKINSDPRINMSNAWVLYW